jgi:signal transduction histidine kinase
MGRIEQVVDEHVASISHDLKNPLSVIAIDVKTLEDCFGEQFSRDARTALRRIALNVAFMDRMIRDLLDLSALDCNRLQLHRDRIDLARLLPDTVERSVIECDRSRVCVDAHEAAVVRCDVTRIERVVANLLLNALTYAPATPVVLRLQTIGGYARVSVIDLGPGLSEDEVATLFAKHHRGRATLHRDSSGLGLFVSRKIIEAHNGRIGAESRIGRGSTFYFELPLFDD